MFLLNPSSLRYRAYRHSQGDVRVAAIEASRPQPEAELHFVLVRPRYVGVCSADIRELRGERPGRSDFGHEVVGTVIESTHPQFLPGDCVILNPFVKIERETAYAERMYLTGSEHHLRSALVKVPTTDLQYCIAEPLACAIHAARRSCTAGTSPKLVLGAGFFGFLLYCYLDHQNVPVTLANRSRRRLDDLVRCSPHLRVSLDLRHHNCEFSTVFLMQARIALEDITACAAVVAPQGEIVLFGAIDPGKDPALYVTRNQQQRTPYSHEGKLLALQGTLDASATDLQEAIGLLGRPEFVRMLLPIFATPLTFERGATHLTQRARSPQSYRKYIVDMDAHLSLLSHSTVSGL
jgi:cyclitol reductase